LNPDETDRVLDFTAAYPGAGRNDLLQPRRPDLVDVRTTQIHLTADRKFQVLEAGDATARLGAEWLYEGIDLTDTSGRASRDIESIFLNLLVPVVGGRASSGRTAVLELSAGARHDSYSDSSSITSTQYGFHWSPVERFQVHGQLGQRFHAPSLYQLNLSPFSLEVPVRDPKRNETSIATIISGGRRDLAPSTASSSTVGFALTPLGGLRLTADYWRVHVEDRIATLPIETLLANEDLLPGRVIRADSTGPIVVPGPIQSIDIGWMNLGEIEAAGIDLGLRHESSLWGGKLVTKFDATVNTEFSLRDLPPPVGTYVDRVGIASEQGTILRHRAILAVTWSDELFRITANVRHHPRYRDSSAGVAQPFHVPSETLVDLNASLKFGAARVTIGATNLFDSTPGFSRMSSLGYDPSQSEMRKRFVYIDLGYSF
jgi:iron complex outermembrane receptor protein